MKGWYAAVGYADEWEKHHQGGAIGYDDRDYVIYPGIDAEVQPDQAFAWNPTITGAKVEDTIIVDEEDVEVVTQAGTALPFPSNWRAAPTSCPASSPANETVGRDELVLSIPVFEPVP